jgi:hypothetical protein
VVESKWGNEYAGWTSYKGGHYFEDDEFDVEFLREDLRDAIYDAMAGSKQWLVALMCESVYPEDPELAERFIDRGKLSEKVLDEALSNMTVLDPDAVLADVFDRAYMM